MKCEKCEENGMLLLKIVDVNLQKSTNKIKNGLIKYVEFLKKKCYLEKGYFLIECETKKQINPKTGTQLTRYQCSNKHDIFISKNKETVFDQKF